MNRNLKRALIFTGLVLLALALINFLLPFGLPKPGMMNCGPDQWLWTGENIRDKGDFLAYLQAHEVELLRGSNTPRLGGFPPGVTVSPMNVQLDWESIADQIVVKHRIGYTLYQLTYRHPACNPGQTYTLKMTSYGFAELYGCCGI